LSFALIQSQQKASISTRMHRSKIYELSFILTTNQNIARELPSTTAVVTSDVRFKWTAIRKLERNMHGEHVLKQPQLSQ